MSYGSNRYFHESIKRCSPSILNRRIGYVATKIANTQCPQHGFHVRSQGHAIVRVDRKEGWELVLGQAMNNVIRGTAEIRVKTGHMMEYISNMWLYSVL